MCAVSTVVQHRNLIGFPSIVQPRTSLNQFPLVFACPVVWGWEPSGEMFPGPSEGSSCFLSGRVGWASAFCSSPVSRLKFIWRFPHLLWVKAHLGNFTSLCPKVGVVQLEVLHPQKRGQKGHNWGNSHLPKGTNLRPCSTAKIQSCWYVALLREVEMV